MRKVEVTQVTTFRDGGTILCKDKYGDEYYIDNRIGISEEKKGLVHTKYPYTEGDVILYDVELVITNCIHNKYWSKSWEIKKQIDKKV